MIVVCGLELLRFAVNVHCRGIQLGNASRLDHLINMCRAALSKDVLTDCTNFADTIMSEVTAWNDKGSDKPDHLRSHLMLYEGKFMVGFGLNVAQKKGWNGFSLDGLKTSEKDFKKKLRVLTFNDDLETEYEPPVFDTESGTYSLKDILKFTWDGLNKPLVPALSGQNIRTLIR